MQSKKAFLKLKQKFLDIFPSSKEITIVRSPGRINLIGEHTDYNGGFVLPVALNLEMKGAASRRRDRKIILYSENFKTHSEFSLDEKIERDNQAPWSNYPRGVIHFLKEKGFEINGINIYYSSNIPLGAGLSSSAAIEMATAFLLQECFGFKMNPLDMIKLCRKAENEFVGVACGIMDQFVIRLAEKAKAIFLNCSDLSYELVPFSNKDVKIIVCNTMVKRSLETSAYNERFSECNEALKILGGFDREKFERLKSGLPPKILKRARHVITENERVRESVSFLKSSDFISFGKRMYESHRSLKDDYEVSCPELDLMVELAKSAAGTLGARMTGAGFGGCTVNLVSEDSADIFKREVAEGYRKKTGISPQVYISAIEGGVQRIE